MKLLFIHKIKTIRNRLEWLQTALTPQERRALIVVLFLFLLGCAVRLWR